MGGHQMQWGVDRIGCNGRAQNGTGWMGQSCYRQMSSLEIQAGEGREDRKGGWVGG